MMNTATLSLTDSETGKLVKSFHSTSGPVFLGRGGRKDTRCLQLGSGYFREDDDGRGSKAMSKRHAVVTWENNVPCLTDLDSTNGTMVDRDGELNSLSSNVPYRLKSGDIVTFGRQMSGKKTSSTSTYLPMTLIVSVKSKAGTSLPVDSENDFVTSIFNTLQPHKLDSELLPTTSTSTETHTPEVLEEEEEEVTQDYSLEKKEVEEVVVVEISSKSGYGLSEEDLLQSDMEEAVMRSQSGEVEEEEEDQPEIEEEDEQVLVVEVEVDEEEEEIEEEMMEEEEEEMIEPEDEEEIEQENEDDVIDAAGEEVDQDPWGLDGQPLVIQDSIESENEDEDQVSTGPTSGADRTSLGDRSPFPRRADWSRSASVELGTTPFSEQGDAAISEASHNATSPSSSSIPIHAKDQVISEAAQVDRPPSPVSPERAEPVALPSTSANDAWAPIGPPRATARFPIIMSLRQRINDVKSNSHFGTALSIEDDAGSQASHLPSPSSSPEMSIASQSEGELSAEEEGEEEEEEDEFAAFGLDDHLDIGHHDWEMDAVDWEVDAIDDLDDAFEPFRTARRGDFLSDLDDQLLAAPFPFSSSSGNSHKRSYDESISESDILGPELAEGANLIPASTIILREIAPLPKRQALRIGSAAAIGFVAGVVATVFGLSSISDIQ